jgi:hypothetical protein
MAKRVRVLQFVLPFPMFQPEPQDPKDGPGGPAPTPRARRQSTEADGRPIAGQGSLWDAERKEAA